jgi:hypothetical protein
MVHIDWGVVLWLGGSILFVGGFLFWFCFFRDEH